jgi:hypothetical protein
MIDPTVIQLLDNCSRSKASYLTYINNLDTMYDIEFITNLYHIMRLQKESLEMMMQLLYEKQEYLKTITYSTRIIMEKYNGENDAIDYYVFPQLTPNIENGDKLTFVRAGMWFKDEILANAFAEALKVTYKGEITKKLV